MRKIKSIASLISEAERSASETEREMRDIARELGLLGDEDQVVLDEDLLSLLVEAEEMSDEELWRLLDA